MTSQQAHDTTPGTTRQAHGRRRKPVLLDPPRPYFTQLAGRPRWLPLAVIVSQFTDPTWERTHFAIVIRCPFCGRLHGGHGFPLEDPPLDRDRERCAHCSLPGADEYAIVRPDEAAAILSLFSAGGAV